LTVVGITNNFFVLNFKLIIIIIIIIIIIVLYNFYAGYLQLRIYLKQTIFLGYIFAAVLYLPFILRVISHIKGLVLIIIIYFDIYAVETPWDNVHV
jgi:hypothetical protein